VPVSSYIVRIRRSAGSSTLSPFPEPGCRAVKGPVPSSHSRCYVTRIVAETGSESELKQGLLPVHRCRHEEANDDPNSNEKGADKSGLSSCDHPPFQRQNSHNTWTGTRDRVRNARVLPDYYDDPWSGRELHMSNMGRFEFTHSGLKCEGHP
jgi:hypothetical protein